MWKKVSESGFSESFLISSVHSVTFCSQVHSNLTPDWTIYYLVVQLLSHVQLFATPWTAACQASLSFTISLNLPKLMSIELMMLSNNLILCHPLLLLLSIFSSIRVFSNELLLHIKGQMSGALASATVLPMNIQGWLPLGLTGLISLLSKGLSRVFSSTTVLKRQFFDVQPSLWPNSLTSIHDYWKNYSFDCTALCRQSNVSAFKYGV